MSEIAGKLSIQVGAYHLQKHNGGSGILLGGVPGTERGNVVIIGGGVAGKNAARVAIGIGANVTIIDNSLIKLRELNDIFGNLINTLYSTKDNIQYALLTADLVIGSVLIPGKEAPKLVTEKMIQTMKPKSVLVDIAIDQGGCFETSTPTTHANPIYVQHNIIHYCVANMPSAVAKTATAALTNATLPYVLEIANNTRISYVMSPIVNTKLWSNGLKAGIV